MSAPAASPILTARRLMVVAALAIALALGYLAVQNLQVSAIYYLTPTEAKSRAVSAGAAVRLGGQVQRDTLVYDPVTRALRFTIGDGVTSVDVVGSGAPPGLLREGAGAVVEGSFASDGTFQATQVIAKHDEVYRAPPPGATPSHKSNP